MQGYNISCDECYHEFQHIPQYAKGDPRNIVLIGHWDGFQAFRSTGQHGCGKKNLDFILLHVHVHYAGTIDYTIGTMAKYDRARTSEVYVAGFVPNYLVPNKRPHSLDPFLHPLLSEIEDIFING